MSRKGKSAMKHRIPQEKEDRALSAHFRRLAALTLAGYFVLIVLLFFLMGEQLHLRRSRGEIPQRPATASVVELVQGETVEQTFVNRVQRLERVSVQWGGYYRQNTGRVQLMLYRLSDGATLIAGEFDAAAITEGYITSMEAEEPIEGLYGEELCLRVTSPDGVAGNAVTPLMDDTAVMEDGKLYHNGKPMTGVLCFSAEGTDYIWTGLHYWEFAAGFGLVLAAGLLYLLFCERTGRKNAVLYALAAVEKYRFLIRQLVARDFKTKYKRSVLGVLWSILNPLLMMSVQYVIFSTLFKSDVPYFAIYLLTGVVMFNFFSEAAGMCLMSILGNAPLITKVYIPKYIYPLSRTLSSGVNLLISLIPLAAAVLFAGLPLRKSMLLTVFPLLCLFLFVLGLGMLLSAMMVFFRDTQFLWGIVSMLWMYATPIFYPETILSDQLRAVLQWNPLFQFIRFARICIIDGISPEPVVYVQCFLTALGMLLVGAAVFRWKQDRFVLYI